MSQAIAIQQKRSRMIITTCLGLTGAVAFIILYWIFSGSLEQIETVIAGFVFAAIMGGIALLSRRGQVTLASWLLVGLLTVLITLDLIGYGIETPAPASYVFPILLAAFCLGLWPALGIAAIGSTAGWISAWVETSSATALPTADISHLTFNAPILTVILFVSALMAGYWSRQIEQ
jgi:hypothetical protein